MKPERTPQRRIDDRHPNAKIDWTAPGAPAVPQSSTAGAAKGGITSEESSAASQVEAAAPQQSETANDRVLDAFAIEADADTDAELREGGPKRLIAFDYFKRGFAFASGAAPASQAQAAPIVRPGEKWSKGHDSKGNENRDELACAGINVDTADFPHQNAVEFYAQTLAVAKARRDAVLAAITYLAAPAVIDQPTAAEIRALQTIAEFHVTDPGNMDAWNMQAIAIRALKEAAPAEVPSDSAMLDFLDKWAANNRAEGWNEFHFAFDTNGTARQQIAEQMEIEAQQSRTQGESGGEE